MHSCSDWSTSACSSLAVPERADGVEGFLSFCPYCGPLTEPAKQFRKITFTAYSFVISPELNKYSKTIKEHKTLSHTFTTSSNDKS